MKKTYVVLIIFTVLVLAGASSLYENPPASAQAVESSTEAAADYYLKIPGIEGEATHRLHKGELVIDSFQWGNSVPTAWTKVGLQPGVTTGGVAMEDFFFSAPLSKASPRLMQSVADSSRFDGVVFTVRKNVAPEPVILKVTLDNVGITSYHVSGMSSRPSDTFSLDYRRVTYAYNVLADDGSVAETIVGSWNLDTNKP
jgi:type VI secretion system secreted protein Hcp